MSSFQRTTNQYVGWKWWQVNVHFNTVFLHKYQHILLFQEDDGVYSSLLRPLFLFFSVLQYTHTLYHCPLIGTVFSWGLYVLKELFSNVFMNEWIQCLTFLSPSSYGSLTQLEFDFLPDRVHTTGAFWLLLSKISLIF